MAFFLVICERAKLIIIILLYNDNQTHQDFVILVFISHNLLIYLIEMGFSDKAI